MTWRRRDAVPYEPGNQAARTHGVWASDVPDLAVRLAEEIFPPELVARFPLIAIRGAETWIRLRRAEDDIAERGVIIDGKDHPLLRFVSQWDKFLLEVAREYGMTPRAEAGLARERADAARQVVDLDAIRARGRATIDTRGT